MTERYNDLDTSVVARLAVGGALIAGWIGIILAINAALGGNEIGGGILLIAAALAFGVVINRKGP